MPTRARLPLITFLLLCAVACQNNPIAVAETTEQKAFATYGTFTVWEEQAAILLCQPNAEAQCPGNPELPDSVKSGIKLADARAKPVADSLYNATTEFGNMIDQVKKGDSPAAMLDIATANLLDWINKAKPLVAELIAAIQGGRREAH